jgi:hypothetical protein
MILRSVGGGALRGIAGLLLLAQFVPVQRTNPPATRGLSAPSTVAETLRRACYDCHSNETRWPWYSRVAPISWMVARDVRRGRQEINFSDWSSYYPATKRRKLRWMDRALRREAMPPLRYRLFHPSARLSDEDLAALERWIDSQLLPPSLGSRKGGNQ